MPSAIDWLAGSDDTLAYASVAPPDRWVPPPAPAANLAGVFAQHGYSIDVDHARRVIGVWHAETVEPLPDLAALDGALAQPGAIRVGVGLEAAELTWDSTQAPHAPFTGATGTGKTTVILCAIVQAARHGFRVWALDPKESEFGLLEGRCERVARGLDECWAALIDAEAMMRERQARMREHGVEHWAQFPASIRSWSWWTRRSTCSPRASATRSGVHARQRG
ncbi:MAG: FtsK/SpoIIIE domain-containing protein [Actinomycetota bacterium]|nr:FtsK/SpoIIIE domain-containing protein [Actinomycetota bacterium]